MKFVCSLYRVPADQYVPIARAAEEAGFEAVSLSDHLVHIGEVRSRFPYSEDGARPWAAEDDFPDVWVATAMMAAVTRRLRFLQAVYVLPARDPFSTAKALGSLAHLSGQRVALGFGVGWMREEFELMGLDFERRGARAEEMIGLMKALWTGESVDHRGEFFRVEGVSMRPAAGGPIPILCSGESAAALRRAARIGDGWIAPISVSTPSLLAARLETIQSHRRESGRASTAFSVYWTLGETHEVEALRSLARLGVTHCFVSPWRFTAAQTLSIEEKCDLIARFGRDTIAPADRSLR